MQIVSETSHKYLFPPIPPSPHPPSKKMEERKNALLLQSVLGDDDVPIPPRIQHFADEMRDLFADAFVEKSHNERLVQDASIGASTALSSRRKPIDGALAQILKKDKAQLEMSGPDDLNSWLIDRVRLIGNPKIKKEDVQEALAKIAIKQPHLEYQLHSDELTALEGTNIEQVEREGMKLYGDEERKAPWHVWAPASTRPPFTPAQLESMGSKDRDMTSASSSAADEEAKNMLGHYYGGIADWFAPSEKQKKQAAEAKILKVLQKTSHPALVFARDYYQTYDRTFDPVKVQYLPMQQTLNRTRATLEMFRNSNRGGDYELIKVLLDRDLLEADLALDPAREDKLSELEKLLRERWSRIKLVHV
jgi:hypothetical protein